MLTAPDGDSRPATPAARPPFDVIILDLGLPDIDGVDVITRIRRRSRVPIIVLSARHGSDDKVKALDAGADDYVTKPFGLDELLARLGVPAVSTPDRRAEQDRSSTIGGLHRGPGQRPRDPRRRTSG